MDDIEELEEKNDVLRQKLQKLIEKKNKLLNERTVTSGFVVSPTYMSTFNGNLNFK